MTKLHEKLKCLGYYGFGGGYSLVASRDEFYCNDCPTQTECWNKHKSRVATIFPESTKAFEEMAKEVQGPDLMKQWFDLVKTADPYTLVMTGNLEDGSLVASNLPPADRGEGTLPTELWQRLVKGH